MALSLTDGFDSYAPGLASATGGILADTSAWIDSTAATIQATTGRFGGNSLRFPAATVSNVRFKADGNFPAFAFWFKASAAMGRDTAILNFGVTSGTPGSLTLSSSGVVTIRDGAGNLRITTPPGSITTTGDWQWLELSFRNGSIVMSVNAIPVGTYTGAYTAPVLNNITLCSVIVASGAPDMWVDDLVVWNGDGSFFNTYGIAPRRIQLAQTDANGTPVQWTPASGTNWAAVKSADWVGGVGVTAATSGLKDRYSFTDLAATPGAIDAVVVKTQVVNTGGDPATLAHVASTGAAEVSSTPQTVPLTKGVLRSAFYRDANGVAWTAATVNAAEFGQTLGI